MKNFTTTIYYGKAVPNIPVIKHELQKQLNKTELNYAKSIADVFINKTLISKAFFDATHSSTSVTTTRKFDVPYSKVTLKKEIVEYAALIIFGNMFNNDSCPNILDVTLTYKCSKGIVCDSALQQFAKDNPTDIYEITLSTRAL